MTRLHAAWFTVSCAMATAAPLPPQEPATVIAWHEAHGPSSVAAIPADAVNVRAFDFDDGALAALARCTKLERLDLSGMDVNDQGYAVSLRITDAGVAHLGALTSLRWLSLAQCHAVKGEGLRALENLPLLESLDLTYSGVESPAVERLALLPSLRELTLSHCMNFHGRSLAEVAKAPGLRTLRLRACTTMSAADAMHLTHLRGLRHLDLRDCQGRFRGQRAFGLGGRDADAPPPPVEDEVGITDAVVAALADLPLETLLLGGAESLTDAIGPTLAKMPALRSLDLSNLPATTGGLLAKVPGHLTELWLDDNPQFTPADLMRVPALPALRTLGLSGLHLDEKSLERLLADKPLRTLHLGGIPMRGKGDARVAAAPMPAGCGQIVAKCTDLESLDLSDAAFVDRAFTTAIATLPRLRELNLKGPLTKPLLDRGDTIRGLAENRSLRTLRLVWNRVSADSLAALHGLPLRELDLYGTNLADAEVRAAAAAWPRCTVQMPRGQSYVVPGG